MVNDTRPERPLPLFDIHRQGRPWSGNEVREHLQRLGECKVEVIDGRLFFDDDQRLMLLGMLLENVGIDAALDLADLDRWSESLAVKLLR